MANAGLVSPLPLFSTRWHRVAHLCPRLRVHVELRRQAQRGVEWFLLVDTASDLVRRLDPAAHAFVGRCDGHTPVHRIWDALLQVAPNEVMSQDEVVQLLTTLHEQQLLEFDHAPDVEAVFRGRERAHRRRRWQGVNPLSFRLPMVDPSAWTARLAPWAAWLFSGRGFLLWSLLVLAALSAGAPQLHEFTAEAARLLSSPGQLALAWLIYPAIKLVHEAAHALAMQRWGLVPRRAGVTLMLLTPVPFVDASAADGLRQGLRRAVVSAAGILAELAIAAVAMLLWLVVEPGTVRDLLLSVVLIGTLSTVLVNGNPLMRFDGYYVLCDLLDLRNLATRSGRWWAGQLRRRLLGDDSVVPLVCMPGERPWLVAYAPLAAACRWMLGLAAVLWVGGHSRVLGAAVAALLLWGLVGRPLLATFTVLRAQRGAAPWLRAALAVLTVLLLVAVVPLPHRAVALGVVSPPERSQLRAGADGFLVAWQASDGQVLRAGDPVVRLEDDVLSVRRAMLAAEAAEADVELFAAQLASPDEAPALRERLGLVHAELARVDARLDALNLRAPVAGTLVVPRQADLSDTFRRRGELIGHVLDGSPMVLRVALPHADADLVREAADEVEVRIASEPGVVRRGRVMRGAGGAIGRLPHAALGALSGGQIPTLPDDADGLTTLWPVLVLDVEVPDIGADHLGERAHVRFEMPARPLAERVARQLRQLLLGRFDPSV